jgi:hypothetical protein
MQLPDYWLPRPSFALDAATRRACDQWLAVAIAEGLHTPLRSTLTIPKWQFLCYLADEHQFALHGSGDGAIREFEPRQPSDVTTFGNQRAVYAAADGLWPLYFAIIDRTQQKVSLLNGCMRVARGADQVSDPFYLFSVSHHALASRPWRTGFVYILPRTTFVQEPPFTMGDVTVHSAQLASHAAVTPLAKLAVTPDDFPLLGQIRGHDDTRLVEYVAAVRRGGPLPE